MPDVFISYSRKDEPFAQKVAAALAEQKRDVWLDKEDIEFTADWKQRVFRGIESANAFICILTPDYATSSVCREEADHAIANNKRLVPVLRRAIDFSALPPAIAAINALPFAETDDFSVGVGKLSAALDLDFAWLDQHTRLLQRALEWDGKARDRSLVLRGSDLRAAEEWLTQAGSARDRNPTELQTAYILASRRASNRQLRTLLGIAAAVVVVTIALATWATIQRGIAQRRTREVSQNLSRSDFLEATRRLEANETGAALAHLARALRVDPQNAIAQRRTIALLSQRNWQFPVFDPIVHSAGVDGVELSPDSKRAVTSCGIGPVQLWSLENGQRIAELLTTPTLPKVLFNPDGTRVAVVYDRAFGETLPGVRGELFDGATGQRVAELAQRSGSLVTAAFTKDSRRLLVALRQGNDSGEICAYNAANSGPAQTLLITKDGVPEAFDATGVRAVVLERETGSAVDANRQIARVWDLRTGKPATLSFRHDEEVEAAIFSPDGDHIATRTKSRAFVWDLAADKLLFSTEPVPEQRLLWHIAYSPDAKQLLLVNVEHPTREVDWTAQIYNSVSNEQIGGEIQDHGLFGESAFSADSKFLLLCSSGLRARVWHAKSTESAEPIEATAPLEHADVVAVAKMTPDGRRFVTGSFDKTLRVWDATPGIGAALPDNLESTVPVYFIETSATTKRIAAISTEPPALQIWDATTLKAIAGLTPQTHAIRCAHFSIDERRLITGSEDGMARVWDANTGQLVIELKHPSGGQIDCVRLSKDGSHALSATSTDFVVWDLASGRATPLRVSGNESFPGVEFTPDGSRLIIARDGQLTAWDVGSGASIWGPFSFPSATDVRFSPDGNRFVAFGQEETAGIFETATGKLEHTLVHRGVVADAVFSNDGRLVATCSFVMKTSGYAQVWDAKTGTAISQPLPGREELHRVALSPDSTLVCATERGGGVRVWTVETGRECLDPLPHDAAAFPVAFTSDGKRLFTVANGKVQLHELWDLPGPAPAWLPDLAEAVGGLKMSDKGVAVPIGSPVQALAILRAKGSAMTTDDRLSIWARWFFADRHTRMASPFSQPTPSH